MSDKKQKVLPIAEGYQPKDRVERGYQPQANTPLDPKILKPPTGGTAIQAPKTPKSKKG
jgi:hypothetical protein